MNKDSISLILNNLQQDVLHFSILIILVTAVFVLWTAGAKLMELKGLDRWPAVFAIIPLFWLITAIFDPKPDKSRVLTQRLSLIFGMVSLAFVAFVLKTI